MTMQITGEILMWMQIGPGKAGRDALPNHSYLEFAMYRLLISAAGGNLFGWVAEKAPRAVRGCGFPMDHHCPGLSWWFGKLPWGKGKELGLGRDDHPSQHRFLLVLVVLARLKPPAWRRINNRVLRRCALQGPPSWPPGAI